MSRVDYKTAAQYIGIANDFTVDLGVDLPPVPQSGSYVYFMLCHHEDQRVKIGHAKDIAKRMSQSQVGCPFEISTIAFMWTKDARTLERRLHNHFAAERTHGEWFILSPPLRKFIASVRLDLLQSADAKLARIFAAAGVYGDAA